MKKLFHSLLNFKVLMLMYFSGFTFVYLFLDLVWWKTGSLPTSTAWQILGGAMLLATTQHLIYDQNILHTLSRKKQFTIHFIVDYVLVLALLWLFGWSRSISVVGIALFTVIFTVAFAAIHWGFNLYYSAMGERMNQQLEKYKKPYSNLKHD